VERKGAVMGLMVVVVGGWFLMFWSCATLNNVTGEMEAKPIAKIVDFRARY